VLIAALAWYSGRASLNHSIKNGGTGSAWTIPRPRSGKFFYRGKRGNRGNRGGATEFPPVIPSTPAWQTTAHDGGFLPSSNTEAQQQFAHQGWQMAKEEPFVTTNEAVTPAPTYISIGDNYGIPTPGAGETDAIRDNTGSQPAKYEGVRAGQAEGLGLLQGEGRLVVRRKEVSRKSVPGHGNMSGRL
jgi:hypothetical protein